MNKSGYLQILQAHQSALDTFLAGLSEAQRAEPNVCGKWSTKDLVAHFPAWTRYVTSMARVYARKRPVTPHELWALAPPPSDLKDDALNEWMVEQTRSWSFGEVVGVNREVFAQLIGTVESLTESELLDPDLEIPGLGWKKGKPLWEVLASMSHKHVDDHLVGLRASLGI